MNRIVASCIEGRIACACRCRVRARRAAAARLHARVMLMRCCVCARRGWASIHSSLRDTIDLERTDAIHAQGALRWVSSLRWVS
jgi:hypothetical protein